MRKTVNVKEPTELELKFEDGKSLILLFDMQALLNLNDLPDGMSSFVNTTSVERCAMVVYVAGLKHQNDLTLEESRKIVSNMDPNSITEIMIEFINSAGASNNEMLKEIQKKTMMEFITSMKLK